MEARISRRLQGDIGERAAAVWLLSQPRTSVFVPFGHSPDVDLVAEIDGQLVRFRSRHRPCSSTTGVITYRSRTQGGNRSWSGVVKHFSPARCDYLFVLVADGRQWFIPSDAVDGGSGIVVGGPKYAAYQVQRGRSFDVTQVA